MKKEYFSYLLEKIQSRISGWMGNFLSMGGRLALIRSVLTSISLHVLAVLPIPKAILNSMDRLIAKFLWGQGIEKKHHWVKYDRICRPKAVGGLGINSLTNNMRAFRGKMAWNFLKQESLWARFAKTRFKVGKTGSPIWNRISRHISNIRRVSYWEYGDGSQIIDKYCWHYDSPCRSDIKGLPIAEVLRRPSIRNSFLDGVPSICKKFYRDPLTNSNSGQLRWLGNVSGTFTLRHYRNQFNDSHGRNDWGLQIWKSWIPEKISIFIWRLLLNALPLDENIRRMGIQIASRCTCCWDNVETSTHLFLTGQWALNLWRLLANAFECTKPTSFQSLITDWILPAGKKDSLANFKLGMAFYGLWDIWIGRNGQRHEEGTGFSIFSLPRRANDLARMIPYLQTDSAIFKRIFMLFQIRMDLRNKWAGDWRYWIPPSGGISMDIYMPSTPESNRGAALCRTQKGDLSFGYVFAAKEVDSIDALCLYLRLCLSKAREHGITVSGIQCSHYQMFSWDRTNGVCNPLTYYDIIKSLMIFFSVDKCRRVHNMITHAAHCLAFVGNPDQIYRDSHELPRSARLSVAQDKAHLPVFCTSEEGAADFASNSASIDERNRSRRPFNFIDDTNIV